MKIFFWVFVISLFRDKQLYEFKLHYLHGVKNEVNFAVCQKIELITSENARKQMTLTFPIVPLTTNFISFLEAPLITATLRHV